MLTCLQSAGASSGTLFRTRRDHSPVAVRSGSDVELSNYVPESS